MKRIVYSISLALIVIVSLSGCASMAPKYSKPEPPVPAAWPSGESYNYSPAVKDDKKASDIAWSEFFTDERLRKVIALALDNNRDLRVSVLNIEKSRALYQIQGADLLPTINASGSALAQRISENLSQSGHAMTTHQYGLGVGFSSYELDLFGRIKSLKDKALEEYLATGEAARSIRISLIAEIANVYLTLAADRERLKIAMETLESRKASYNLIKGRFEAGASSELDLRQAQVSLEAARIDAARFVSQIAIDENAISLLAGCAVPVDLLSSALSPISALSDFKPAIPSDVLISRPDIMQAEHLLKAANANIGAARAAFFPRISLTTSAGLTSDELSGLFKGGSAVWSFAPQIAMPIFDSGRMSAGLKAAEVDREIMLTRYEKAIQSAFKEVSDALAQRGTLKEQTAAQQSLFEAASAGYRLADARYRGGIDSYLTVLDSQRTLYSAQQGLVSIRLLNLTSLVTLYKVMGGGGI